MFIQSIELTKAGWGMFWPITMLSLAQDADKVALAEWTGLDQKQVNNWFINQRKRHWKPTEEMHAEILDGLYGSLDEWEWQGCGSSSFINFSLCNIKLVMIDHNKLRVLCSWTTSALFCFMNIVMWIILQDTCK